MTRYADTADRLFDAGQAIRVPFDSLSRWVRAANAGLRKWRRIRDGRLLLDCMSEAQLEDLGIRRVARNVRWLDHDEVFSCGEFSYHLLAGDEVGSMALPHAGGSAIFQGNFKR